MSTLAVHVPRSLRARLESLAQEEGVSVEQLIASALAEKVAVLDAEVYFQQRAKRADRAAYDAMLDSAPDVQAHPEGAVRDVRAARGGEERSLPQERRSPFDDAMAAYRAAMEQVGASYDEALLKAVAKGLGPAIYNTDSKLVSCSDPEELKRVKDNFLIKKLGMADSDRLMSGIHAVCEQTKGLKGRKHRAVFYYLLVQHFRDRKSVV